MEEWLEKYKLALVLIFFAFIILLVLFFFSGNKKEEEKLNFLENEKPVITCSNSGEVSNVIINQKIEVYDVESERILAQITEMSVEKEELQETLDVVFNSALNQQKQLIEEEFGKDFEYIKVETDSKDSTKIMKVYYIYNDKNFNDMLKIFNFNVYSSTYNEIISYFESGGLVCERE